MAKKGAAKRTGAVKSGARKPVAARKTVVGGGGAKRTPVQRAKRTVRKEVRQTYRKARAAGDTSGNFSPREAKRTARSVIRYSTKKPFTGLAPEFIQPIRKYEGRKGAKATKTALRTISRRSN